MNKKRLILIIVLCILVIGIVLFLLLGTSKTEKINDLKITYSDKSVTFNDFSKDFKVEQTITIENISSESKTYSLEWSDVKNTLKKQNAFTYEIKCTGDRCATLGKSQVPVTSATVYQQVLIEGGSKQGYTIIYNYSGSDKGRFSGKLRVHPEIIDTKKIEEQEKKEREKIEKELERDRKDETKLDA